MEGVEWTHLRICLREYPCSAGQWLYTARLYHLPRLRGCSLGESRCCMIGTWYRAVYKQITKEESSDFYHVLSRSTSFTAPIAV